MLNFYGSFFTLIIIIIIGYHHHHHHNHHRRRRRRHRCLFAFIWLKTRITKNIIIKNKLLRPTWMLSRKLAHLYRVVRVHSAALAVMRWLGVCHVRVSCRNGKDTAIVATERE